MRIKKIILGGAFILIGLPLLLVLVTVIWFQTADRTNGVLLSSDQRREYLLHVPASYDSLSPVPLVISLHGAAGWPAQQMSLSGWNRLAEEHGFIVVYPSGTGLPRIWHVDRGPGLERDVRFITELIDTLTATYGIDPARVYVNGLSNGGGMAFVLSCAIPDRIAAVGTVAAAQSLPWDWCRDRRPVPLISFHGTTDPIVPYAGGRSSLSPDTFPNVRSWTASWARRNGCDEVPVESAVAADVAKLEYPSCADDAAVVLYTVEGGGHSWPGGKPLPEWLVGTTTQHIDATERMWAFFRGIDRGGPRP